MIIQAAQTAVLFCFTFIILTKAWALLLTIGAIVARGASTECLVTISALVIITIGGAIGLVHRSWMVTRGTSILGVPFL
jgi:hypothetical protein